jgi:3'-phosphoadenosine 5'-phosphosulfate sulfotransferase (PAPS reductase)/FAD synthetase
MKNGDTIAVWFSCGAASAVAAKKTIEKYGETNEILVINNPVIEEDEDNLRFLKDVSVWLGKEIIIANNPDYPANSAVDVWKDKEYMSGQTTAGATCTFLLKIKARQKFEDNHRIDYHVLGFTYDEIERHKRFVKGERENVIPVLIDEKLTKQDCFDIIMANGIELPRVYKQGYPNANCIGCVKATSPTYWNHVRKIHPHIFDARAKQSREIGARLVRYKGVRIFLDELPKDAMGKRMKSYECGIFCDTN